MSHIVPTISVTRKPPNISVQEKGRLAGDPDLRMNGCEVFYLMPPPRELVTFGLPGE